ncbi:MAG: tetratricopeptide repeat protein [Bacteroidaceae bacterium]|nr:tetratricopeptide repeat protein [Bacteroidaceae bacterium]
MRFCIKISYLFALLLIIAGCGRTSVKELVGVESILLDNPDSAAVILDGINSSQLRGRKAAIYGMLRSIADYKTGRTITTDSLARLGTDRFGHRKGHWASSSWYALGCVSSRLEKDPDAIYAMLKARDLSRDTLSGQYASTLQLLGHHYIRRGMYDEALKSFERCRPLFERLGDNSAVSFCRFKSALAYSGKGDYNTSGNMFRELLRDPYLDAESRNDCYLYLAQALNMMQDDVVDKDAAAIELSLANRYIAGCTDEEKAAAGYTMKGIALYYLQQTDSAFHYLSRSLAATNDLEITSLNFKALSKVASRWGEYRIYYNDMEMYVMYQDSINRRMSRQDVADVRLKHNDEMQQLRMKARSLGILLSSGLLAVAAIAATIIIYIQRDRRRQAYYVQQHDEFVRKQNSERYDTVSNQLESLCTRFRSGTAYSLINDVGMEHRSFRMEERDLVTHDINLYFGDMIGALRAECGKVGQNEINLLFLTALGLNQDLIADIMCTSRSNMRSIKSRLKSKISAESFSLYFKE